MVSIARRQRDARHSSDAQSAARLVVVLILVGTALAAGACRRHRPRHGRILFGRQRAPVHAELCRPCAAALLGGGAHDAPLPQRGVAGRAPANDPVLRRLDLADVPADGAPVRRARRAVGGHRAQYRAGLHAGPCQLDAPRRAADVLHAGNRQCGGGDPVRGAAGQAPASVVACRRRARRAGDAVQIDRRLRLRRRARLCGDRAQGTAPSGDARAVAGRGASPSSSFRRRLSGTCSTAMSGCRSRRGACRAAADSIPCGCWNSSAARRSTCFRCCSCPS